MGNAGFLRLSLIDVTKQLIEDLQTNLAFLWERDGKVIGGGETPRERDRKTDQAGYLYYKDYKHKSAQNHFENFSKGFEVRKSGMFNIKIRAQNGNPSHAWAWKRSCVR